MNIFRGNGYKFVISLFTVLVTPAHAYFTGPYVGLNAGYSSGSSDTTTYTNFVPNAYFAESDISQINDAGSKDLGLHNFIGGIQAGYNYRDGNGLVGIEADFDSIAGSQSDSRSVTYLSDATAQFTLYTKIKTNWLFTLRPRIGYIVNCTLFYLTGGLAIAQLKTNNTFSDNFVLDTEASNAFESASQSQSKTGGVIGAGFEYAVTNNISVKGEYLYTRIGHISSSGSLSLNPAFTTELGLSPSAPFHHKANFISNIFRIGFNYNFG